MDDITLDIYEGVVTLRSEAGADALDNSHLSMIQGNAIANGDMLLFGTDENDNAVFDVFAKVKSSARDKKD